MTIRVGLISDTHGLLRAEAERALRGCDHIVHAGDICDPQILAALARLAPVTAVRGNNDRGPWAARLPAMAAVRIASAQILVIHDRATLDIDPRSIGATVVVSGHSHCPSIEKRDGVLYVNPGSAGPRRFRLPVSLGFLTIVDAGVRARLRELGVSPPAPSAPRPTAARTRSSPPSRPKAAASARAPRR